MVGHSWNEIHQRIARRHALDVDMDTLIAAAVEEKRALVATTGLPVMPGAVDAVRRLGSRSPLAVVSGAEEMTKLLSAAAPTLPTTSIARTRTVCVPTDRPV